MTNEKTNALAIVPAQQTTLEPQNINEAMAIAAQAAKSRFFAGASSPEAALVIIMTGRSLGIDAMTALRAIHIIEGKPTLSADAMVAVCLRAKDVCEYFKTIESTADTCTVEAKRRGQEPQRLTFTMDDARRAGLLGKGDKSGWHKFPAAMLRARAKSALARDAFPDLILGLYDPDELAHEARGPGPAVTFVPHDPETGELVEGYSNASLTPASRLAGSLRARLLGARSLEEAKAIAGEIKNAALSDHDRVVLRETYKSVIAALVLDARPTPTEPVSPEPTPEQGDAFEGPAS